MPALVQQQPLVHEAVVHAKLAVTVVVAVTVKTHVAPDPQLPPDQPVNARPEAGVAVSVTWVPAANVCWQLLVLQMTPGWPAALIWTVPDAASGEMSSVNV